MAPRDGARVQLDFPQLVADIIAQLNLTGTVGVLEMSDQVTPVYIVAQRAGALAFTADLPVFQSAEITSANVFNPAVNTIIGDTGALAAGDYDIWGAISLAGDTGITAINVVALQHRNAANTATLATLLQAAHIGPLQLSANPALAPTGYRIALNERLRFIALSSFDGTIATVIAARLRPTP